MYYDSRDLKIYVDGSVFKNPGGPGGIAGIIEYPDEMKEGFKKIFSEGYRASTNNRMELLACIKGMHYLRINEKKFRGLRKILVTDSEYIYNNHMHADNWRKNGWLNLDGKPIENEDLWKAFLKEWKKVGVEILLIKGKSNEITKAVDKLAKKAAKFPTKTDDGYRQGRVTPKVSGEKTADIFPAKGQILLIRIYRHYYKKAGNYRKIYFNVFSESENGYYGNYYAYVSHRKEIHSRKCYEATFNKDTKMPLLKDHKIKECPLNN
ncbi:MAG: hypothetical protein PHO28_01450 [Candidatus Pacebacteria bacterium]|nr:hypothetical protein [Candidatus Paceibacterota bacterium]